MALVRRNVQEQVDVLKDLNSWQESMFEKERQIEAQNEVDSGLSGIDVSISDETDMKYGTSKDESINCDYSLQCSNSSSSGVEKTGALQYMSLNESDERRRGNTLFAERKYVDAIKSYTKCLILNGYSCAICYSNRSMAYLKVLEWSQAEEDASSAIAIDQTHIKSYHRRAMARLRLGKVRAALVDINTAKSINKNSKDDSSQKEKFTKLLDREHHRLMKVFLAIVKSSPRRLLEVTLSNDDIEQHKVNEESSLPGKTIDNTSSQEQTVSIRQLKSPSSWIQFEQSWKILSEIERREYLLKYVSPQTLLKLYVNNGFEDVDVLLEIVSLVSQLEASQEYSFHLRKIPNLDMNLLMISCRKKRDKLKAFLKI
eukprot:CAMPEP_0116076748 /NCGR_PEP_ID=MMETSP0322-20121206/17461_1 /TAXON_ID=163516 /ORGANISM="Leptocylindrus danicus var. apora, Strain B651" /LENGTH=370 /DNA_ID=CAMNT_0003567149 /DNA_START=585 /DNA_END=1697 /DNA_ORIENTATION=+